MGGKATMTADELRVKARRAEAALVEAQAEYEAALDGQRRLGQLHGMQAMGERVDPKEMEAAEALANTVLTRETTILFLKDRLDELVMEWRDLAKAEARSGARRWDEQHKQLTAAFETAKAEMLTALDAKHGPAIRVNSTESAAHHEVQRMLTTTHGDALRRLCVTGNPNVPATPQVAVAESKTIPKEVHQNEFAVA